MIPRGFILALQFLTRLPTPAVADFRPADLGAAAVWFPLVGLVVGTLVAAALVTGAAVDPWLGALAALIAWVWVTGALHLDGLADLADALGAAHRDQGRLLAVLRDPHIGTFGVVSLVLVLLTKLALLMLLARAARLMWALPLLAAWARLGAVIWSQTLPPLAAGIGERFAWTARGTSLWLWTAALLVLSLAVTPVLVVAPLLLAGWWWFLKRRLGGMTGDCLGAGVELTETALLAVVVIVHAS